MRFDIGVTKSLQLSGGDFGGYRISLTIDRWKLVGWSATA